MDTRPPTTYTEYVERLLHSLERCPLMHATSYLDLECVALRLVEGEYMHTFPDKFQWSIVFDTYFREFRVSKSTFAGTDFGAQHSFTVEHGAKFMAYLIPAINEVRRILGLKNSESSASKKVG